MLMAGQPKTAKSAIIQKLSKQWPMSTKTLANCLQKEFALNVTYQAVHKALNQLEDEKVIGRTEKGYQLHEEWIASISKLSQDISKKYSRNEPLTFDKEIIQMNFTKWIDAGRFVSFDFMEGAPNPDGKVVVTGWMHVWPVNTVSIEEMQRLAEVAKKEKQYFICPRNTTLDTIFAGYLEKIYKRNLTAVPTVLDHDYVVKGDFVAQVYYEKSFYDKVNTFYNQTKDANTIDYSKLQKLVTEKTIVHVVILRNSELAEKLRSETMVFFKEKKRK